MAFVDDKQREMLLSKAFEALETGDAAHSNELYRDIVQTLTRLCNKNQKEIANELQQMAKTIEEAPKSGEAFAFEFKQRTCAVMLEISMEDRRRILVDGLNMEPASAPTAPPPVPRASVEPPSQSFDPASTDYFNSGAPVRTKIIGGDPADAESTATGDGGNDSKGDATRVQSSSTAIDTAIPFMSVEYLYIGSSDYERDLTYYREVLGAQEVWKFDRFGSRITAFSVSAGPLLLIADHRAGPSCQPVFRVSDLSSCARDLMARGWKPLAGPFGTPNGEAYSFEDPSGNRFAIFQVDETSTDRAYFDPTEGEHE